MAMLVDMNDLIDLFCFVKRTLVDLPVEMVLFHFLQFTKAIYEVLYLVHLICAMTQTHTYEYIYIYI